MIFTGTTSGTAYESAITELLEISCGSGQKRQQVLIGIYKLE
ncbi:hypothetical protein Q4534_10350 [Cyclobacterium sp. 1_MG-2023]|nr:hypothetical protein [Cyclobacterium sp. 1_MG-2023]